MSKYSRRDILLLIGISMITMSVISFEMLLTRLFSTILAYHFAFLVTSLAILGSGIGGMIAYKKENISSIFTNYSIILPFSYLFIILMIYLRPFLDNLTYYSVLATMPFLIAGMIISTIFKKNAHISNRIYFADLIGSALGSLAILLLLNHKGFIYSLFGIAFVGALGSLALVDSRKKQRKFVLALPIILLGIILYQGTVMKQIETNFLAYDTSPYTLMGALRDSKQPVKSTDFIGWNAMARTDVIETQDPNEKIIISDGGASAPMIKFSGDLDEIEYLKDEVGFIPFAFGNNESSLIIGSGGGRDIVFALLGGVDKIDAVEINPLTIKAADKYKDFNGGIYDMPGVELFIEDGRSFIEKTTEKYDNIYLSLVMSNAVEHSALAMSEGYVFTQEALEKYLDLLTDNGKLSFVMHSSTDLFRGLNTAIQGLINRGVDKDKVLDYFAIINSMSLEDSQKRGTSIHKPVLIVKKSPFTEAEYQELWKVINEQERQTIHVKPSTILKDYVDFSEGKLDFNELINGTPLNLKPITDQNPFFYNFTPGGSNTLKVLIFVSLLALLGIFKTTKKVETKRSSLYFTLLGIAFMLVEIPLIQKIVLFVGNPTQAFSYVLFILLVSSGLGSLFNKLTIWNKYSKNKYLPLLFSGLLLFGQSMAIRSVIPMFMGANIGTKLILMILIISPLGFFMGMPFARGIWLLGEYERENDIPLMWGVNGIASVLGSTLALMLSMEWGFYTSEILAGAIYIILFVVEFIKREETVAL
ncbi:spermine synthase [Alkaliphilus oremlandii]|uniref:Spermine synthase n=1 Tax=Alkaliphilus oremlandii (strain OhILAs) TaxID=350688 RepID=A8MGR1_ALKOO|nr:spermine synthase [Alkaliphilus oremlandii]ABW18605.1 spermine synthase [Alkaliphilus oremlandii OhILAs]